MTPKPNDLERIFLAAGKVVVLIDYDNTAGVSNGVAGPKGGDVNPAIVERLFRDCMAGKEVTVAVLSNRTYFESDVLGFVINKNGSYIYNFPKLIDQVKAKLRAAGKDENLIKLSKITWADVVYNTAPGKHWDDMKAAYDYMESIGYDWSDPAPSETSSTVKTAAASSSDDAAAQTRVYEKFKEYLESKTFQDQQEKIFAEATFIRGINDSSKFFVFPAVVNKLLVTWAQTGEIIDRPVVVRVFDDYLGHHGVWSHLLQNLQLLPGISKEHGPLIFYIPELVKVFQIWGAASAGFEYPYIKEYPCGISAGSQTFLSFPVVIRQCVFSGKGLIPTDIRQVFTNSEILQSLAECDDNHNLGTFLFPHWKEQSVHRYIFPPLRVLGSNLIQNLTDYNLYFGRTDFSQYGHDGIMSQISGKLLAGVNVVESALRSIFTDIKCDGVTVHIEPQLDALGVLQPTPCFHKYEKLHDGKDVTYEFHYYDLGKKTDRMFIVCAADGWVQHDGVKSVDGMHWTFSFKAKAADKVEYKFWSRDNSGQECWMADPKSPYTVGVHGNSCGYVGSFIFDLSMVPQFSARAEEGVAAAVSVAATRHIACLAGVVDASQGDDPTQLESLNVARDGFNSLRMFGSATKGDKLVVALHDPSPRVMSPAVDPLKTQQ